MITEAEAKIQNNIVSLLKQICETPSPTFKEQKRAELIKNMFQEAGFKPQLDKVGNVITKVKGGTGPKVLIAAHLDTVFPDTVDLRVKAQNDKLLAPGIGDNSASLAMLVYMLQNLPEKRPQLIVAASVGEEGVGDLYGIRELMKTYQNDVDLVIALDGHLGTIVSHGVGSKRFEVKLRAKGGHSWGDYPSPSATHALGDIIHNLTHISIPREPRSSLNIGEVSGGTSINAIAQEARFNLDLRSLDKNVLEQLERETKQRIQKVVRQHGVLAEVSQIGDRPTAKSPNEKLVLLARHVLRQIDIIPRTAASSTDANIPMSLGLPAIAFGVYHGGDAHRLSEWLEPSSLIKGYKAFALLLSELSSYKR